ncbi:hypothetical protein ACP4OV_003767 [Aristida adscensionis]
MSLPACLVRVLASLLAGACTYDPELKFYSLLRHVVTKELLKARMLNTHSVMLLLMDRGVDPCVLNGAGKTPRDVIEEREFDELNSMDPLIWRELKKESSMRPGRSPPSLAYRQRGPSGSDYFNRRIDTYLVVAALVTTVTFAANFTTGGYNQTDGTAIHSHRMAFKVFIVFNTIAMSSSTVMILCFLSGWKDPTNSKKVDHLIWGQTLTIIACLALLISLVAAVDVTVAPTVRWPVYTVILICISVPVIAGFIQGKEMILYTPPPTDPLTATNDAGDTPLHEAVRHRWGDVVLVLLDVDPGGGHTPNKAREKPLHVAAREGLTDVVHKIVSSGSQLPRVVSGSTSGTALHQASLGGHIRIVKMLSEKHLGLIGLTDYDGNTALHYAAQQNHRLAVDTLLGERRELASQCHKAIEMLLRHCPDSPELVDDDGRNAFHAAAASGKTNTLKYLLRRARRKDLLNRGDKKDDTPLHLAARMSHVYSAMSLLGDHFVDPCVINGAGKTPREVLEERGFDKLDSLELYIWRELKKRESGRRRPGGRQAVAQPNAARHRGASGSDYFERRIETYLLVAALVATVTFAATFTMPGGYNQSDGTAIHSHRTAFKVFVISNTVATSSSSVVLLCFLWAWQDPLKSKLDHLIWGHRLTILASFGMLVSLMAAVDITVTVRWPVYTVIGIGISVPFIAGFILGKEIFYIPL